MPEFNDPFALNAIISNAESQNTYASLSSYNAVVNVEPIINETPPPVVFPVQCLQKYKCIVGKMKMI